MQLRLYGSFIKEDVIYFQLRCTNYSNISYDIDRLRFFIHDKRQRKRTASQEIELNPICVAGNTSKVNARANAMIVIALPKFTIPDAKYFVMEMKEKNGARNLQLKIGNRQIVDSQVIKPI
jgi:conjugative transposon TraN protein